MKHTDISVRESELMNIYSRLGINHGETVWKKKLIKKIKENNFRADNPYIWQTRMYDITNYALTYYFVKNIDKYNLLDDMHEDGSFEAETFNFEGKTVSRDLLDSCLEIGYLKDIVKLESSDCVLDIGAGYGRLAKRLIETNSASKVFCVDAVPRSTAISELYLSSEIRQERVEVLPLHHIEKIKSTRIKVAVSVHALPEMTMSSIKYWAEVLRDNKIEYLFIVPNSFELKTNEGKDFSGIFLDYGYKPMNNSRKYPPSVINEFGIYPVGYFCLQRIN